MFYRFTFRKLRLAVDLPYDLVFSAWKFQGDQLPNTVQILF
jgi:hypothetical protein